MRSEKEFFEKEFYYLPLAPLGQTASHFSHCGVSHPPLTSRTHSTFVRAWKGEGVPELFSTCATPVFTKPVRLNSSDTFRRGIEVAPHLHPSHWTWAMPY